MGYIFVADSMGLYLFKFLWWAPKDVCNATQRIIAIQGQFKVIQGRWFWYQSKARIWFHISDQCWLANPNEFLFII